jgi:uncharacterized radical SAM protein YgiQ
MARNSPTPAPDRQAPRRTASFNPEFLPMSRAEMDRLGWDQIDVLLVTGDAYVDHPSFGAALLGRWLGEHGYRVGIVAQPRWDTPEDVARLGRPRLFAGVTAGALDSMLAHYTAFRKKRRDDAYTPGGRAGARPNRACIVYTNLIRQAFPGLPVVLGGIEASLRRITHYDFWTDKLRRSILLDAKADLILYGMAERSILAVADAMPAPPPGCHGRDSGCHGCASQQPCSDIPANSAAMAPSPWAWRSVPGAVFLAQETDPAPAGNVIVIVLPSHEELLADPKRLMEAALALERHVHRGDAFAVQRVEGRLLILTPPPEPLSAEQLDRLYSLPFTREPHPSYQEPVPAADMIRFSITSHRGCGGGCSFCSLALHQGRRIVSRSRGSILDEARAMTRHNRWTGAVSDIGGPTANMWGARCAADPRRCRRASCLFPAICPNFQADQSAILDLLQAVRLLPGVRHVRVASGVRFDLALQDDRYVRGLIRDFVGGQLKIAPEHVCDRVLALMRKPPAATFEQFLGIFQEESNKAGKRQFVVPYLISAFPGCTDGDMRDLARWLADRNWRPQQVQCFIPLPGTVAAAMYCARIDIEGRSIPVARSDAERLKHHHMLAASTQNRSKRGPAARPGRKSQQ